MGVPFKLLSLKSAFETFVSETTSVPIVNYILPGILAPSPIAFDFLTECLPGEVVYVRYGSSWDTLGFARKIIEDIR